MYVIAEITRLKAISNYYAPEYPFCVSRRHWYGDANEDIASFWSTDLGVTEPLTERTYITGIVYANTANYSVKNSLSQCLLDSESYYWNNTDQILTIHYNQLYHIDYTDLNFDVGIAIGLTNDKVRYFESRPYWPFLIDFPQIETSVDKFNYDQLSFIVDTISADNRTGFFNQFKNIPIFGNKVSIKTGNEGDEYTDLIERVNYYVEDYNFSADKFDLDVQDIRKTLTAQVPNKILNTTDYANLGDHSLGKVLSFGYSPTNGFIHDIEGHCINENDLIANDPDFIFLEVLRGSSSSDITVWVQSSDKVWIEDTGATVNWTTGIVTVPDAKTGTTPYSVLPVKADVRGIANDHASDIIKDLNERFLGLTYDTSNYDTTEWEIEELYLAPISLYMDKTKDIYQWIKEVQSLSSVGFRYTSTSDNKRVIRIDNPNKSITLTVPSVRVKNIAEIVAESNKDDVYNKIYIGYNASIVNDTAARAENTDYFSESFSKYKIEKVYNKVSGLTTLVEATNRAVIQAEDYYQIHRVFEIILIGEQYLDLKLYDIIEVNISLETLKFIQNNVYIDTIGVANKLIPSLTNIKTFQEVLSSIETELIGDEYFGLVRGQIISKKPDYNLKTNKIRLREREHSSVWEDIYG